MNSVKTYTSVSSTSDFCLFSYFVNEKSTWDKISSIQQIAVDNSVAQYTGGLAVVLYL